jgi:clan AA aspartic protease
MITGVVSAHREAVVQLDLVDANGDIHSLNAVVDTGFDRWIALPPYIIAALELHLERSGSGVLADGSVATFDIYEARIRWDGSTTTVSVYELDSQPLVGMSLMYGYELLLPILDGATFTLRRIVNP